jgi:hypothetical protein
MNENVVSRMYRAVPFLARRSHQETIMFMWNLHRNVQRYKPQIIACLCLALWTKAQAYTVVTISTGAPTGLEQQFLSATTNQFQASLLVNPLASNTYQLKLFGLNPNYNPLPTNLQLLDSLVSVDSWTYVAGWSNGESYQQSVTQNILAGYLVQCSSPTAFNLMQTSSSTFYLSTCQDTISTLINAIGQLHLSTPTIVPGNWQ